MKMKTTDEFIADAVSVHGDTYDYSSVVYSGSRNKVTIICKNHGSWDQEAASHLMGHGCKKCRDSRLSMTTEEFIERSVRIHGSKYSYEDVQYVTHKIPVTIHCEKHGKFKQNPHAHLQGKGCLQCQSYDTISYIKLASIKHEHKYDYSKVEYNGFNSMISIICPNHGEFTQRANSHLTGNGCPSCNSSKGEKMIRQILTDIGVEFNQQYKFKNCKNKNSLPFDFYLPTINTCIEYQGIHHYQPIRWNSKLSSFEATMLYDNVKHNDTIKRNFCSVNDIRLLEITYEMKIEQIKTLITNLVNTKETYA
jgi:Zn finger protein HypA/HybF involved in hydrogenase expression